MEPSQPANPKPTAAPPAKPPAKPTTAPAPVKPKPTQTKAPVVPPVNTPSGPSNRLPTSISGSIEASPTSQPNNNSSSNSSKGFPISATAGIAAAAGLIVLLIFTIVCCRMRRARSYSKRDFGHDPSRDPINPNDVLPPLEKNPEMMEQGLRTQQPLENAYQASNNHIQPPFASQGPETANRGPPAGMSAQTGPAPILTNMPMDGPRSPSRMSPSQRAQANFQQQADNGQDAMMYRTPRARQQQQPSEAQPGAGAVNGMGNQPLLRSDTIGSDIGGQSNVDSTDRLNDGSDVQSELSYRQPPVRNQESRTGNPPSSPSSSTSGPSSPNANGPMPQQHGSQPRPFNNASPYSSPRQAPSHPSPRQAPSYPSPRQASPRPNQMPYQLPHPQQPYSQQPYQPYNSHSPQARPMYGPGPSSPGYPQQRPPYSGGSIRSPVSPRGQGYPQSSPNFRPRPAY
ncbi:MAG: hypothetical protein J3Q66DRAFT_348432 [Benniella sp.]|nr:MAG: hypothetical protein J3Q66DRAFT_348432 [Benniella sp.]